MDTDGKISRARLEEIRETIEIEGMNISYLHFTIDEIELIIDQTPLKDDVKELCRMRYIHEKTIDEIAEAQGIDRKTVISRIHKASQRLKKTAQRIFK